MQRVGIPTTAILMAALALAGCNRHPKPMMVSQATLENSVSNEMVEADPTMATRLSMTGQAFADTLAASDAFEIAEAKLEQATGSRAEVKSFADTMIEAHGASTTRLQQVLSAANSPIVPHPALSPAQQGKLDKLGKLDGAAFEDAYLHDQIEAHEAMIASLADYAAHGDVPTLVSFARQLAPDVRGHLGMARGLAK